MKSETFPNFMENSVNSFMYASKKCQCVTYENLYAEIKEKLLTNSFIRSIQFSIF